MKQKAKVVKHDGTLMAEVVRSEACQSCHACQFGQKEKVYVALDGLPCKEGDTVDIELDNASFSAASIIAYGIPAAAFIIAIIIARLFTENEIIQAVAAALRLAIGLFCVRISEKDHRRKGDFKPKITLSEEEE